MPVGSATTVVDPSAARRTRTVPPASTTSASRSSPGAAPVSRSNSPSCGVRTVGPRPRAQCLRVEAVKAIGVENDRQLELPEGRPPLSRGRGRLAEPGPERRRLHPRHAIQRVVLQPAVRQVQADVLGRPADRSARVDPGSRGARIRRRPADAPSVTSRAAPAMVGDPAITATPLRTCASCGREVGASATSSSSTSGWSRCCSRGRSARRGLRRSAPGRRQAGARLQRAERDRVDGVDRAATRCSPVSPSMPLGMSQASTGVRPGSGGLYCRGGRCRTRRRSRGRPEAELGRIGGIDDETAAPRCASTPPRPARRRRCCPSPPTTTTRRPYAPPISAIACSASRYPARPTSASCVVDLRGALVDGPHLGDRHDRLHPV